MRHYLYLILTLIVCFSCATNPYKATEKVYTENVNKLKETISSKEIEPLPVVTKTILTIDSTYTRVLYKFSDTIAKIGSPSLKSGIQTEWIGTVNFNLRKPNFIIIHHTAQDSIQQTIKTFTMPQTKVSAHYVIGDDGKVIQMLNDYLRAWHAGIGSWGKNKDINSASIGIELDNNGSEPFSEAQITSLMALLSKLTKQYDIPKENILGHADIAPSRKKDPSPLFPWKTLAQNGFGLWEEDVLVPAPENFNAEQALRIIGYTTKNLDAAVKAFKLHYIQTEVDSVLDEKTIKVIYSIYKQL